ncbi:MAG: hypothetical protein U9N39_07610 [Campylobacterota bacterium]|nr:hypothetical protein [Campylobacterota bacterium]
MKFLFLALLSAAMLFGGSQFKTNYQELNAEFTKQETATPVKEQAASSVRDNRNLITQVYTFGEVTQYSKTHKYLAVKKPGYQLSNSEVQNIAANLQAAKVLYYKHSTGHYYYYFGS